MADSTTATEEASTCTLATRWVLLRHCRRCSDLIRSKKRTAWTFTTSCSSWLAEKTYTKLPSIPTGSPAFSISAAELESGRLTWPSKLFFQNNDNANLSSKYLDAEVVGLDLVNIQPDKYVSSAADEVATC